MTLRERRHHKHMRAEATRPKCDEIWCSYDRTGYHDMSWRILTGNVVEDMCGDDSVWVIEQLFEEISDGRWGFVDSSCGRTMVTLLELAFRHTCQEHRNDYRSCEHDFEVSHAVG